MMISTKGRYALRCMIDLAETQENGYVPLKEIANRQNISLKYLEQIVPSLVRNGLLEGALGKSGGYRLTRNAEEYRVSEILRLTEGDLAPVACLTCHAAPCERAESCRTLPMWKSFYAMVNEFFDHITLAEFLQNTAENEI